MERFRVAGGARLAGSVRVTGAKNSALKLMAAALLAPGETVLREVPRILDVDIMGELLRRLGCAVTQEDDTTVRVDVPARPRVEADYDLVRRLRASICVLGPLLARCGEARVARPGGDNIGSRGLDLHIEGLVKLGATVESEHGFLIATAPRGLTGAQIWLDFPSVGATENILMAAVLARGTTVIDNAAREPEIVDLCELLSKMGAKIGGAGTSTIEIHGVEDLQPADHTTVPDRIVAGTYAVAAAMTQGDVTIVNGRAEHLEIALDKLTSAGAHVERDADGFRVTMDRRPKAVDIVTLPYPGFATDLQPQFAALNAIAEGTAMVTENIFEARFVFLQELTRLGANVRTEGHHAIVRGIERLSGAPVRATDVRAGAGLVLAGLVADGVTTVSDVYHIDRGYADLPGDLRALGADIVREPDPDYFPVS
ncbi:UDP-N-acetylglucosamine 1-carboxyvinyltransferase [Carbonactinospora thermoautotrophica]|uniref:UDP-N-acetylglucosamine 1-carboxyvinyltransferase n=1 Tax=Carbonactinospora thermoautotrophica TaxID=1469144 RepID=A0A132N1Q2_9ACTN|nr:UDP-N-acetylglucosamine 1-carboxyvinyltransferase [Carbonactinospora thermoautotrophica]KWX04071.1 UDP-N-acetylglucosamine 1-carboxyvinyltransferase [Carbonactinospora thermoautotrophica]KWX06824.1 UDP-N-acetylglucosamine 1-carboxyvinyltransferase [Carbonactinospora thermoautotrophica]